MRIIINSLMSVAVALGQTNVGSEGTLRYRLLSPAYQGLISLAAKLEAK